MLLPPQANKEQASIIISTYKEKEHEISRRMQAKAQVHAAAVSEQRKADRKHLQTIYRRHEAHIDGKIAQTMREAEERARRHEATLSDLNERTNEKLASQAAHRRAKQQQQQEHLEEVLRQEAEAHAKTAARDKAEQKREEERRAQQQALVTSRRIATGELSRKRAELALRQENLEVSLGPCGGEERMEDYLLSLSEEAQTFFTPLAEAECEAE